MDREVKITILDHNYLHLENYPPSVRELLSYQTKTYNRYNKKWKVSINSVIDLANSTTYTGLVQHICEDTIDIDLTFVDQRQFPSINFYEPVLTKPLRGYQIDYLIRALKEKRMIIHAETGSGKTVIMAAILDSLRLPTLVLAPNKTIMGQLHKELGQLLPHYTFGSASGEKLDMSHNVVIGLASTLVKLPVEDLQRFDVILADEAHTVAAQQAHDVILSTNAGYRFGFSGTPRGRSDNRDLVVQGLLGPIVKLVDREELVESGYLAKTRVEFIRGCWGGDYVAEEDLLIVRNPKRNALIKQVVKDNKNSTILILVRRVEHGKILQELLGKESMFIFGDSEMDEREDVRQAVKDGKIRILIASNKIFGSGLDIENLELGINAAGGKSDIITGQGVGRVVRPWNEICKRWIEIYDDYAGTVQEHSKERLQTFKDMGIPIDFIGFPPGMESRLRGE